MNSIQWNSPLWYVFLSLSIALGITAVLYYKSKKFEDQPAWVSGLLPVLRFLSIGLVLLLLLNPLIKSIENEAIKPTLLIARDASNSIQLKGDSARMLKSIEEIGQEALDEKYALEFINFGSDVRSGYSEEFGEKAPIYLQYSSMPKNNTEAEISVASYY